jgi:hypothetical protein
VAGVCAAEAGLCNEAFIEFKEMDETTVSFLTITGFDEGVAIINGPGVFMRRGAGAGAGAGAGDCLGLNPYEKHTYIPAKKERNKNKYNTYDNVLSDFAIYIIN